MLQTWQGALKCQFKHEVYNHYLGIFSIQLLLPLCRDANRTVTVIYRYINRYMVFFIRSQVLSFVYCVLHQTQAFICTEDQSHVSPTHVSRRSLL